MVPYLDIHTHQTKVALGTHSIQNLVVGDSVFLAMPKTKPISIGIHPWFSNVADFEKNIKYIKVLAQQRNVVLLGECGLDKLRGEEMPFQLKVFEAQLLLAEALSKPVIIHCVKAFDELIALKKRLKPTVPLIVHGFNKKIEMAQQLVQQGFYLSFGTAVLTNENVAQVVSTFNTPFFLETDDSEFSIQEIYQKVAEVRNITVDELKDIIFANWKMLGLI